MKTPPLLIGFALLLWGMQTGFVAFAAVMGLLLEASHFIKSRWEFSEKEYHRIFDLCALLFLGALAIAVTSEDVRVPALALVQWQPFVFFPIISAQAYGSMEKLSLRSFSWFLRRRKSGLAEKRVNISYLYLGVCLLSASAVSPGRSSSELFGAFGTQTFYFAIAALLIWTFMSVRPPRVNRSVWIVLISCVAFFGYFGQVGLNVLQRYLETALTGFVGRFARTDGGAMESQTAIGKVGKIKLSGKIVWRVEPQNGTPPPMLLRQASYDTYGRRIWRATRHDVGEVSIVTNDVWRILPDVEPTVSVQISGYLHKGEGVLPLQAGIVELRGLQVTKVETNSMGMTRGSEGMSFIRFLANSTPGTSFAVPPADEDLFVNEREVPVLNRLVEELELDSPDKTLDEKLRIIHRFFQDNFTYSLEITRDHVDETRRHTALTLFLTRARSGHCEYFATATVLLARAAGIPARYATGFAVQESTGDGSMYVVRERHAHAWTLVYREDTGVWEDFDTTPASWDEMEKQASFWQPITDAWSRLMYEFSKWRYGESNFRDYAVWLLVPLILILVWRIVFNKKRKRTTGKSDGDRETDWPGLDSELYQMEAELARRGLVRAPSETVVDWKKRVAAIDCIPGEAFDTAVELHARYRFDPHGLNSVEREMLRANVRECLQSLRTLPKDQVLAEANSHAG